MIDKPKHSSIPWNAVDDSDWLIACDDGDHYIGVNCGETPDPTDMANIAFVFKAVNAHDGLLAFCKSVVLNTRTLEKDSYHQLLFVQRVIRDRAILAIAKAESPRT